ncbi:hypothetical protein [Streptomyces sp. NPDC003863]
MLGTPHPGQSFTVTVLASDTADDPHRWQFTMRKVVCGKPLDPAVTAYAADSVGSPTTTPPPEAGKQLCVLTMDAVKASKSEASGEADNRVSLNVADTRYTMSQKDSDYTLDYDQGASPVLVDTLC